MKMVLVLVTILLSAQAFGQTHPESTKANAKAEQQIHAIEDKYVALGQKSDYKGIAESLKRTLTEKCTILNGDGSVMDKTSVIKVLSAMADQKDPNLLNETYKYVERQVDVYGDAVVLSAKGLRRTQGEAKAGKKPAEARFTHFFVKQDGEWKIAKIHITDLPAK